MRLREARLQLAQLIAWAELNDTVTVIVDDGGRARAAVVPVAAARSGAQMRVEQDRAAASAAGWQRRVENAREVMRRQHDDEIGALRHALAEAWQCIDEASRPGDAANVHLLRRAHADLLQMPGTPS